MIRESFGLWGFSSCLFFRGTQKARFSFPSRRVASQIPVLYFLLVTCLKAGAFPLRIPLYSGNLWRPKLLPTGLDQVESP